jgi:hypothetical protein
MLQCGNPEELVLRHVIPGGATVERILHRNFYEHRMMGEWFDCPAVLLAFFAGLHDKAIAFLEDRGVPPVGFLGTFRDWEPFSALDRAVMYDNFKAACGRGPYRRANTQALRQVG